MWNLLCLLHYLQNITNKNSSKPKVTTNFAITNMIYYDWWIVKIMLVAVSCKSEIVLITIYQLNSCEIYSLCVGCKLDIFEKI